MVYIMVSTSLLFYMLSSKNVALFMLEVIDLRYFPFILFILKSTSLPWWYSLCDTNQLKNIKKDKEAKKQSLTLHSLNVPT